MNNRQHHSIEETEMPLYGGIDLHANNSVIVLLNEQDQVIYQRRLANHLSTILEQLVPYHADIQGVVVESTYNWYWLVDLKVARKRPSIPCQPHQIWVPRPHV